MKNYPIILYVSKSRALMALERKRHLRDTIAIGKKGIGYVFAIFIAFSLGLSPLLFNFVIDPFNMNKWFNLGIKKEKISLKAHYPLWKILNYPKETSTTLILGDSRALALKDKYWHELGFPLAYNFSYGGGTISEIVDTVNYIKKSKQIKNLFIGIQLRSFSPLFKKGMNRVPEAIELANNPLQYYANGFITEVSWRQLENEYPNQLSSFPINLGLNFVSQAYASDELDFEDNNLNRLLDPLHCTHCILPIVTQSQPSPSLTFVKPRITENLGIWQEIWPSINIFRELPKKFSTQVTKNAKSDWQSFSFSNKYWQGLVEIAKWSNENNVQLIFFIPPTLAEMQQQISNYGYAKLNQQLREDLAQLAPVIDFDFDNKLTRNLDNFNDAYHFNHRVAKLIVGELIQLVSKEETTIQLSKKRRSQVICPINKKEITKQISNHSLVMLQGKSCRIWRGSYE